ncbi:TPA: ISL3 family transposase [Clostridioides difficile]|nr:ISL3 family transposase [Clostridioides difficile]
MDVLNLPDFEVIDTIINEHDMTVIVKPKKEPTICYECGCTEYYKHGKSTRSVKDLNIFDKHVVIEIHSYRYKCKHCNSTFNQKYKSIDERGKITIRLRKQIEKESLKKPFSSIADKYSVSPTTVKRVFEVYMKELEKNIVYTTPIVLSINGLYLKNSVRTIYIDVVHHKILDIQATRNKTDIKAFLNKFPNKKQIEVIIIDMCKHCKEAIYEELPKVKIIIDRFHVLQLITNALEKERKSFKDTLTIKQRKKLLKDKILLSKNREELKDEQIQNMQTIFNEFPHLKLVYELKEQFRDIYGCQNKEDAFKIYEKWKLSVPKNMKYYQEVIKTVDSWYLEIFNYFGYRTANTSTESVNNLIKYIEKAGKGYRFEIFRAKILFETIATNKPKYNKLTSTKIVNTIKPFSWDDSYNKEKLIEGFGVNIPQLLEVFKSDRF